MEGGGDAWEEEVEGCAGVEMARCNLEEDAGGGEAGEVCAGAG